jgi:DNA-binding CsgD family transcriptional regulator
MANLAKQHAARMRWFTHPWKSIVSKEELERLYVVEKLTQAEIAKRLNVSTKQIETAMRKFNMPRRRAVHNRSGLKSWHWKGNRAGYQAKHLRVQKARGKPQRCEMCGTKNPDQKYHWANLTGNYDDVNDYKRMCVPCHKRFDNAK